MAKSHQIRHRCPQRKMAFPIHPEPRQLLLAQSSAGSALMCPYSVMSPTFLLECLRTPSPLVLVLSTYLAFCTPSQMGLSQNLPVGHAKAPVAVSPHLQGFAHLQLVVISVVPLGSRTSASEPVCLRLVLSNLISDVKPSLYRQGEVLLPTWGVACLK